MANLKVNINGVWKEIKDISVNIGGTWRSVIRAQVNIGGTWKDISLFYEWWKGTLSEVWDKIRRIVVTNTTESTSTFRQFIRNRQVVWRGTCA